MQLFTKSNIAFILILLSVISYGFYTGIQKQSGNSIPDPMTLAFYISIYSSIFLSPFAINSIVKEKNKKFFISKDVFWPLIQISFFSQFLALSIKLFALTLTTATTAGLITAFSSVTLTMYAVIMLKEKLPKSFFIILGIMCLGLGLFKQKTGEFGLQLGLGEISLFGFIFLTSFSNTLAKISMNKNVSSHITSFARPFLSIPLFGIIVFIRGTFNIRDLFSFWPILAGFALAFRLATLYAGVNLTKLSNVAVINVVAPLFTFAYAFIFLKERLNPIQTSGAILIIFGAYLLTLIKTKQENNWFNKVLILLGFKKQSVVIEEV